METRHKRVGLTVHEAGWVMQHTESEVRGMLKRGELAYSVSGRKIDPASVEPHLVGGLAHESLRWLLAGRITAPKPETLYGQPASLFAGLDQLILASPTLMVDPTTGDSQITINYEQSDRSLNPVLSFVM